MMRNLVYFSALLVLAVGCATKTATTSQTGPSATCEVCRYNRDLACVCVKVNDTTPRTDYDGQTYYFCSEDCRKAFLNKPKKYLSHHTAIH